ncbi:MAG: LLM class F420-dependent oxidoreductase [Oceanicoccus sp.]
MKIGLMLNDSGDKNNSLDNMVAFAKDAEAKGFPSLWMAHIFGYDALTALAVVGRETSTIELGTAVVSVYRQHPFALGQQALTTQAATSGRLNLGIGLAHQPVVEGMFGMSYDKPARYMREFLEILNPVLRGEPSRFSGELLTGRGSMIVEEADKPVKLFVAALGPVMLGLCGKEADGTVTWMTGKKTIESHILPTMSKAASKAGKPSPRVVAGFPICLTNDVDGTKDLISKSLTVYGQLASYRAMLDLEGAAGPADIAVVGDEAAVDAELERIAAAGVTDFNAAIIAGNDEDRQRTMDYLASKV